MLEAIRRMAILQIDTISVVARSPYLVLFSRLGAYPPHWLDELLAEGALFEYWAHEASFLPIEDYALMRHRMLAPDAMGWKYRAEWVAKYRHEMDRVLEHVRGNGAVRSVDFERRDDAASGWWEWKPEKRALEALFTAGELMVARRQSFQRVYDLRERVHPHWSDDDLPSARDVERALILRAVRALGITTERWVADYYRMPKKTTPARVRELAADGDLVEAQVAGWSDVAYIHPDNLELAHAAADGALKPTLTTLLSPFDPLVWDRARASTMFGFDYRIECYTPAPKRQYGYYVLPVLRRGEIVARLDAKAHRAAGEFEVKSLHMEDGVRTSDALLADIAGALRQAADWHGTPDITIGTTAPRTVRKTLLTHLT
ncbi:MAG TPA: crosslink repair DNA glycosylase YcaQ family protein [Longimicrobiales bacterium]|nr:crosslink repair DNA glycosylase YcaQ family protein [Longimicrobiales bacterium]